MNKMVIGVSVVVLVIAGLLLASIGGKNLDNFATCVTQSGVKMYGAYWCPHCQNQKNLFGSSFDKINYIECALPNNQGQTEACNQAGIQSYPTWEFNDGQRIEGEMSLQAISQMTECILQQ